MTDMAEIAQSLDQRCQHQLLLRGTCPVCIRDAEPSTVDRQALDLANRYAIPAWFARSLVSMLGQRIANERCTQAAREWRIKIRQLSGRSMTGINDLGLLRFVYQVELGRIWATESIDARKDFFATRPEDAA